VVAVDSLSLRSFFKDRVLLKVDIDDYLMIMSDNVSDCAALVIRKDN